MLSCLIIDIGLSVNQYVMQSIGCFVKFALIMAFPLPLPMIASNRGLHRARNIDASGEILISGDATSVHWWRMLTGLAYISCQKARSKRISPVEIS